MVALTAVCGLLMVSSIPYPSFKNSALKARVPLLAIMAAALIFAFVSLDPPRVLFLLTGLYLLSGPVLWFKKRFVGKKMRRKKKTKRGIIDEDIPAVSETEAKRQVDLSAELGLPLAVCWCCCSVPEPTTYLR